MDKNFALISLGCPKNLVDSENMVGTLANEGFKTVSDPKEADVIIVNTCSFIQDAREEAIETILGLLKHKKGKCKGIIVCGCLAEMYAEEVLRELPEVDAIVGTGSIHRIAEVAERVLQGQNGCFMSEPGSLAFTGEKRLVSTGPAYAYLKIAEGCDNRCTYCVIPALRGRFRSRDMEGILNEAEILAGQGFTELILVAQDTTRYGLELYGEPKLWDIVSKLNSIGGIRWIRLLYCYPDFINKEFVEKIFINEKVLHYLDIPLQHASERVLKRMGRKGGSGRYLEMVAMLREAVPDIVLRTSIITGFPGETEHDHDLLCKFIKEAEFDRLGVFKYSSEDNTPAARMKNHVSEDVKARRYEEIMKLQKEISLKKNQKRLGKTYDTLVEGVSEDGIFYKGRTYAESPDIDPVIYFAAREQLAPGAMVPVKILDVNEYDLIGDVVNEPAQ